MKFLFILFLCQLSFADEFISKIDEVSASFLGVPYSASGPLGEGEQGLFDQDPLFRKDAFDCTTYVETVLAIARTENEEQAKRELNRIRYSGSISFLNRNHFTSLDWVPDLENKNIIEDITLKLFPIAEVAEANIDKKSWYEFMTLNRMSLVDVLSPTEKKQRLSKFRSIGKDFQVEKASLAYLKIDDALKNLDLIPHGSIVNIVRPNWKLKKYIGTNINVSHQGFAIRKNGVLYYRNASSLKNSAKPLQVADIKMSNYLTIFINHPSAKGINILMPVKP